MTDYDYSVQLTAHTTKQINDYYDYSVQLTAHATIQIND